MSLFAVGRKVREEETDPQRDTKRDTRGHSLGCTFTCFLLLLLLLLLQEFLRVCLQRDPANRPTLTELVQSHPYLQQQQQQQQQQHGAAAAPAAAAGMPSHESSERFSLLSPRSSSRHYSSKRALHAAAATAASTAADADPAAVVAAAAASPPSTAAPAAAEAAELSCSRSLRKKRKQSPLGEAQDFCGVHTPKKSPAAEATAAAAAAAAPRHLGLSRTPSLLPPLLGTRLPQQLQRHPAATTAAATRLLACCDALFGDVGRLVPALIKEREKRRQRGEEGVAFYRQNDPLALDSIPAHSLAPPHSHSPTAAAAAAAAAADGAGGPVGTL